MVVLECVDIEGKLARKVALFMQVVTQAAGRRLLRAAILSRETGQHGALPREAAGRIWAQHDRHPHRRQVERPRARRVATTRAKDAQPARQESQLSKKA